MAKDEGGARAYDAWTGKLVAATDEQAAQAEAIAHGKPLPSDRTAEELASLEPAYVGPVVTAGVVRAPLPQPPVAPSEKRGS